MPPPVLLRMRLLAVIGAVWYPIKRCSHYLVCVWPGVGWAAACLSGRPGLVGIMRHARTCRVAAFAAGSGAVLPRCSACARSCRRRRHQHLAGAGASPRRYRPVSRGSASSVAALRRPRRSGRGLRPAQKAVIIVACARITYYATRSRTRAHVSACARVCTPGRMPLGLGTAACFNATTGAPWHGSAATVLQCEYAY